MRGLRPNDVVMYGSYRVGLFSSVLLGERAAGSTGESHCCSLEAPLAAAGMEGSSAVRKGGTGGAGGRRRSAAPLAMQGSWSAPLVGG